MKSLFVINIAIFSLGIGLNACSNGHDSLQKEEVKTENIDLIAEIDTVTLRRMPLASDIVSNGHVKAMESADVFFRSPEIIDEVYVHNGQRVRKGQQLAKIDLFKLNSEKVKNEASVAQAKLELQDVLIGQGYNPDNLSAVPAEVMKLARVRSGLEQAEASYNTTLNDIEHATLTAPFDGVVANVKGVRHSMANTAEPFCRIINDKAMTVEFPVLESELPMISIGESVEITTYSSGTKHPGHITEVNPMIDDNGQVTVKARVDGTNGLIDGMNVRIRSTHIIGDRLVVPKSAVVLRTGRQVVFTYEDGKAMWNYVTTGLENLDSYEITEGLTEGAAVIVSGNENLAHEAPVNVRH